MVPRRLYGRCPGRRIQGNQTMLAGAYFQTPTLLLPSKNLVSKYASQNGMDSLARYAYIFIPLDVAHFLTRKHGHRILLNLFFKITNKQKTRFRKPTRLQISALWCSNGCIGRASLQTFFSRTWKSWETHILSFSSWIRTAAPTLSGQTFTNWSTTGSIVPTFCN